MKLDKKESDRFNIIPQNERKCVWMEAGVVSYKICDRDFHCETCPLDIGLRGDQAKVINHPKLNFLKKTRKKEKAHSNMLTSTCKRLFKFKLDESRYVNPGHCWVEIRNKNRVRIGLDDIVGTALGSIDEIILPKENDYLERGASCGQIIQFEHIFSIVSPVSGTVKAVNRGLERFPNKIILDPLKSGWLLEIEPDNLQTDLQYCRTGDALLSWYLKEIKWLESNLGMGFNSHNKLVGVTLTDGGEISRNLRNYLPQDQYRRLIISFLGIPDSTSSK